MPYFMGGVERVQPYFLTILQLYFFSMLNYYRDLFLKDTEMKFNTNHLKLPARICTYLFYRIHFLSLSECPMYQLYLIIGLNVTTAHKQFEDCKEIIMKGVY